MKTDVCIETLWRPNIYRDCFQAVVIRCSALNIQLCYRRPAVDGQRVLMVKCLQFIFYVSRLHVSTVDEELQKY